MNTMCRIQKAEGVVPTDLNSRETVIYRFTLQNLFRSGMSHKCVFFMEGGEEPISTIECNREGSFINAQAFASAQRCIIGGKAWALIKLPSLFEIKRLRYISINYCIGVRHEPAGRVSERRGNN